MSERIEANNGRAVTSEKDAPAIRFHRGDIEAIGSFTLRGKPILIPDRSEAIALLRHCSHIRWGNGFNPAEDRIACPGTGRSDLLGALATGGMIAMFSGSENALVGVTRVLNIQANEIGNWSWGSYPIGIPVETVAVFKGLRIRFGEVFDPTLRGAFGNHMHRTGIAPTCAFRPSVH